MSVPRATVKELSTTFGDESSGPRARLFTARHRLAFLAQMVETKGELMMEGVGYDEPDIRAQEGLHLFVRDIVADLDATFDAMRQFSNDLYALAQPDAGPAPSEPAIVFNPTTRAKSIEPVSVVDSSSPPTLA